MEQNTGWLCDASTVNMSKNDMSARPRRAGDTDKQCWSLGAKMLPCLSAT